MSSTSPHELTKAVNAEARLQFPHVVKQLGISSMINTCMPRLALRSQTPYPYSFKEDGNLYPKNDESFGRVIKATREEGMREIHDSISIRQKEHGWLFVPEISKWIDTTVDARETNVTTDQYAHIFLSHLFPEIEAVHTHPDLIVQNLAHDEPWSYSKNYLLEAAQPSTDDLTGHYMMTRRTAQDSHLTSTVVSHYGVTSFGLREDSADTGGFGTERYERFIDDTTQPLDAIQAALIRMQNHVHYDDGFYGYIRWLSATQTVGEHLVRLVRLYSNLTRQ